MVESYEGVFGDDLFHPDTVALAQELATARHVGDLSRFSTALAQAFGPDVPIPFLNLIVVQAELAVNVHELWCLDEGISNVAGHWKTVVQAVADSIHESQSGRP